MYIAKDFLKRIFPAFKHELLGKNKARGLPARKMRSKTINRQPITVSAEARRPRKERCAHHHQGEQPLGTD